MLVPITTILTLAAPALCWDGFGHQTVGFLAQKYFTAETNLLVRDLVGLRPDFDIGDAAAWADTVRDRDNLPWSKNWHFINPKGDDPEHGICTMEWLSDCVGSNCIVAAIANQTAITLDVNRPAIHRRNATMFLLHLFGDLHQPLHTSGFKLGGNAVRPVCFGAAVPCAESSSSLHAVWDASFSRKLRGLPKETTPEEDKAAALAWADDIYRRQNTSGINVETCADLVGSKCIVKYAAESNKLSCTHVLKRGEAWVLANDLSGVYYDENIGVIEQQVGKAGVRLAAWMNALARELKSQERGDLKV